MSTDDDIEVRKATRADLEAVIALVARDAIRPDPDDPGPPLAAHYLTAFAAIEHDPNNAVYVAVRGGEVIGTFQLTIIQYLMYRGRSTALIEGVRVKGSERGRGVGTRMMRWAIDEARRRGCARVQLTTNRERTDAQRFYLRLGFVDSHVGMKLFLG